MTNASISSQIMIDEAEKRGITCVLFDDKKTVLMEKNGISWFTRGARTSLQSSIGKTIADKKHLTKKILAHHSLPTAAHQVIASSKQLDALKELRFPLVMKPLDGNGGKGVVVGINTFEEAVSFYEKALAQGAKSQLFEEMLTGTEYRIVCVNYTFIAASYRKAAFVTGNGVATIQQLIDEKNAHPWRGGGHETPLTNITVDELVETYLQEQGQTLQSIPAHGVEVALRKTVNLSTGGEPWDMTDSVCAENKLLFEKIAKACDLNVIGIDMMCESLETPIINQPTAGVIEVNAAPGLRMHYYPLQGTPRPVASHVLDMVEAFYFPSQS